MHQTRPIIVDDFGVKYKGKENAQHLHNILAEAYEITADWMGEKYIGLTLQLDYTNWEVHLSMPGYVQRALKHFHHEWTGKQQHQPYPHVPPNYGQKFNMHYRQTRNNASTSTKQNSYKR